MLICWKILMVTGLLGRGTTQKKSRRFIFHWISSMAPRFFPRLDGSCWSSPCCFEFFVGYRESPSVIFYFATPQRFNIAHENRSGAKRKGSSSNLHFSGAMLTFAGVMLTQIWIKTKKHLKTFRPPESPESPQKIEPNQQFLASKWFFFFGGGAGVLGAVYIYIYIFYLNMHI